MNLEDLRKEMDTSVWGCRGPDCVGDESWFTIDDSKPKCFVKLHCGHFTSVDICEVAGLVTMCSFRCYINKGLTPADFAKEVTQFHHNMCEFILRLT
jgi:hypothetical protein